jgi:hypothetical protein
MDRDTLYLDNDEEITSVVDKLKGASHASIDLVIPKDALLFQGVVNLKLLRKQAESLGKEITIVTQDKVGTKLAEQIGIPVVAKVGQTPKVVKMAESDPVSFNEEDIEMKEDAPKVGESDDTILDTEEVVEAAAAKETVEDLPKEELKKTAGGGKMAKWKKVGLASGFVFIALFVAAYIYVPLANVSIKLAAEKERVDISFKVDKSYDEVDTGAEVIPASIVEEEKEVTEKYQTTGSRDAGEKASGTVTIVNHEYSTDAFTINAGTRIQTSSGLIYRTKNNVSVPKYIKVGGVVTQEGKVSVDVAADAPGEKYNVVGGKMSIPGLMSSGVTIDDIYATSSNPFTGGSTKTIKFVTQADINKAKEEIGKGAQDELKSAIALKIGDGYRLLDEGLKLEQVSAEPTKKVNEEATEFELKAKYKATAITFKEDDLLKLAEAVLSDKIGSTKEIVEKGSLISTTKFIEADFEKGILSANLSGEAYIAQKLDEDKLKIDLTGENEANAKKYLEGIEGVEEVSVRYFPTFYKRMPRLKNHIYLKTEILKAESIESANKKEDSETSGN